MKIGIITTHKVLNFGSALQAYALQQKLISLGYDNELIDYVYPKPIKKQFTFKGVINSVIVFLRNMLIGFPKKRKKKKFSVFYDQNFKLSQGIYDESNISSLLSYDGYITGSDQVWNPR